MGVQTDTYPDSEACPWTSIGLNRRSASLKKLSVAPAMDSFPILCFDSWMIFRRNF